MTATDLPFLAPIELTGYGVTLRALEERDIQPLFETCQEPATLEWTTIPNPYLYEHAEGFVRNPPPRIWAVTPALAAIADVEDPLAEFARTGAFCGSIELRVHSAHYVSLGYMSAPWARGRGLMISAVCLVRDYAFENGVQRFEIIAYPENLASRRVAEKAGLHCEGILRNREVQRGIMRDCAVYASIPANNTL